MKINKDIILKAIAPNEIFTSNDKDIIKKEYLLLIKKYHPDVYYDKDLGHQLFIKINKLYNSAINGSFNNTIMNNIEVFRFDRKQKFIINYYYKKDFTLGTYYFTKNKVIYIIKPEYEKFYNNFIKQREKIKYPNSNVRTNYKMVLPEIEYHFKTEDGSFLIAINREFEIYPLRNVLNYFNGKLHDRHVTWVLSRLYDFSCLMRYNHLVYNGIDIDNIFIDIDNHLVFYYGFWYTMELERDLIGLPKSVYELLPDKNEKKSKTYNDLISIRNLSKILLGDEFGSKIFYDTTIPKALKTWSLSDNISKNCTKEFERWNDCIIESYGKREFFVLEVEKEKVLI